MVRLSLSDRLIVAAKEAGYTADTSGAVYSPSGNVVTGSPKRSGHLSITLTVNGVNRRGYGSVLAHRFVAYYFMGAAVFEHELVRHINDIPDDNRLTNLALGSKKENRADIPRHVISNNAKKHAGKLVARSRKLSDADVQNLRNDRETLGLSYCTLANNYGVSTMTAYRAVNRQSWREII